LNTPLCGMCFVCLCSFLYVWYIDLPKSAAASVAVEWIPSTLYHKHFVSASVFVLLCQ
jgi:hypothetical protein